MIRGFRHAGTSFWIPKQLLQNIW